MPSELQRLRTAAGYRHATDLAREVNIPPSTYARYEREPEKIPTPNAWALADRLGVPIDVIVGRQIQEEPIVAAPEPEAELSDIQVAYDSLSERSRAALTAFLGYLVQADASNPELSLMNESRRFDAVARRYETMFMAQMEREDDFADFAAFDSAAEMREQFEAFVTERAEKKRVKSGENGFEAEERDRRTISKIMAAYDRQHVTDFGRARVFVEFDSSKPTGREAIL